MTIAIRETTSKSGERISASGAAHSPTIPLVRINEDFVPVDNLGAYFDSIHGDLFVDHSLDLTAPAIVDAYRAGLPLPKGLLVVNGDFKAGLVRVPTFGINVHGDASFSACGRAPGALIYARGRLAIHGTEHHGENFRSIFGERVDLRLGRPTSENYVIRAKKSLTIRDSVIPHIKMNWEYGDHLQVINTHVTAEDGLPGVSHFSGSLSIEESRINIPNVRSIGGDLSIYGEGNVKGLLTDHSVVTSADLMVHGDFDVLGRLPTNLPKSVGGHFSHTYANNPSEDIFNCRKIGIIGGVDHAGSDTSVVMITESDAGVQSFSPMDLVTRFAARPEYYSADFLAFVRLFPTCARHMPEGIRAAGPAHGRRTEAAGPSA